MADVMGFADGVSGPIKLAWILWFAWAFVQVGWYRRARVAPLPVPARPARPERPPRRPRTPCQEPVAQVLPFETNASATIEAADAGSGEPLQTDSPSSA